jgi:hypothetical protein
VPASAAGNCWSTVPLERLRGSCPGCETAKRECLRRSSRSGCHGITARKCLCSSRIVGNVLESWTTPSCSFSVSSTSLTVCRAAASSGPYSRYLLPSAPATFSEQVHTFIDNLEKKVLTVSTPLASDRVVVRWDRLGFLMFSGVSGVFKAGNTVRVPPRAQHIPSSEGFLLYCGGVPLTLGARVVAWPPRWPIQVCGWRVQDPGWWALRLLWWPSSFRLCRVGPGWPTPVHVLWRRDDMTSAISLRAPPAGGLRACPRESSAPRYVLPKRVWTLSTLSSALLEGREDLRPISDRAINLLVAVPEKLSLEPT